MEQKKLALKSVAPHKAPFSTSKRLLVALK